MQNSNTQYPKLQEPRPASPRWTVQNANGPKVRRFRTGAGLWDWRHAGMYVEDVCAAWPTDSPPSPPEEAPVPAVAPNNTPRSGQSAPVRPLREVRVPDSASRKHHPTILPLPAPVYRDCEREGLLFVCRCNSNNFVRKSHSSQDLPVESRPCGMDDLSSSPGCSSRAEVMRRAEPVEALPNVRRGFPPRRRSSSPAPRVGPSLRD